MIDRIHTLDLAFQNLPQTIASYLIPHEGGGVLVETGPGSTTDTLTERLADHDLTPADITDVLLTHIHLDHGGAAGWMARHGATVHVHPAGASHLANPEKLLRSAERIYGDEMDNLWGEFLPVPDEQISVIDGGDTIAIGDLHIQAIETPGHAYHHHAYLLDGVCFTGDVGGVRILGTDHVALPLAPPEIDLDQWRTSVQKLQAADITHLAPTHFGFYEDVETHLDRLARRLDAVDEWLEDVMADDPSDSEFYNRVTRWMRRQAAQDRVDDETWALYETANPSWMAVDGLKRYWKKHRVPSS